MARVTDGGRTDDLAQSPGRILLLGVDAADPRALPELTRRLPTDETTIHRLPALADWAAVERDLRRNPPGALLPAPGRLRGRRSTADAFAALLDDAAADLGVSIDEIGQAAAEPALPWAGWWPLGAWTVTVLVLAVPVAGIAAALHSGGLLLATFATLAAIAAISLFVGFGLARQAVAIRRHDAAAAELLATGVAGDGAEHVIVVPARNAAGIAAELRERRIEAEARRLPPDDASDPLSDRSKPPGS